MPHRTGSFRENWDDLLMRFAERSQHVWPASELLLQAQRESAQSCLCELPDPHQALFERSKKKRRAGDHANSS